MRLDTSPTARPKAPTSFAVPPSNAVTVSAVVLSLSLLVSARTGALAFRQTGQTSQVPSGPAAPIAPPRELQIDGGQAGALDAVIDAAWADGTWIRDKQKAATATATLRKREAAAAKKSGGVHPDSSLDIRDYSFTVSEETTDYKVVYALKNSELIENKTPQGTNLINNSPVYTATVRKSDFKVVDRIISMSAVL